MTVVALPSDTQQARLVSQSTAVEQSRAVAEVQAAVVVAQSNRRDLDLALGEMRDTCGRLALANRAFYTVPNRGHGPSVHLARELARIWGNIDYGVKELRRDDEAGESEVLAYAWDQQANVRSSRSFIAPHVRMKGGKRQPLTDIGDIYLSNQNVGARAVRECLFTVVPTWFTEEAMEICRRTIEHGEGVPLAERVTKMIGGFASIGVSLVQLETRLGSKRGKWTAADVAEMSIVYTSITRDGLAPDDEFPPARVSVGEIVKAKATPVTTDKIPAEDAPEDTPEGAW